MTAVTCLRKGKITYVFLGLRRSTVTLASRPPELRAVRFKNSELSRHCLAHSLSKAALLLPAGVCTSPVYISVLGSVSCLVTEPSYQNDRTHFLLCLRSEKIFAAIEASPDHTVSADSITGIITNERLYRRSLMGLRAPL